MSVAIVTKPAPKPAETSSNKPSSGLPRWAKISLVALAVIAVVAAAYYFYQPQLAEETAKKFSWPAGREEISLEQAASSVKQWLIVQERENCSAENMRPPQEECMQEGEGLKTEQGKLAYEQAQQRLQVECPDRQNFNWDANLASEVWRNTPYPQSQDRVRALAEEHWISTSLAQCPPDKKGNLTTIQGAQKIGIHFKSEKCPPKKSSAATAFCLKTNYREKLLGLWRLAYRNCAPEDKEKIDKVVKALCPGSNCTLSDQNIFNAVGG